MWVDHLHLSLFPAICARTVLQGFCLRITGSSTPVSNDRMLSIFFSFIFLEVGLECPVWIEESELETHRPAPNSAGMRKDNQ